MAYDNFNKLKKKKSSYQESLLVITSCAASLFTFISLLSFHRHDQTWFYTSSLAQPIKNKCGLVGATLAGLLLYICGSASLLFPIIGLYSLWAFMWAKYDWSHEWDRIIALLCCVPVIASLFSFYKMDPLYSIPGGLIGTLIMHFLKSSFDVVGALIVIHTLLCVCMVLVFRLSFVIIGQYIVAAVRYTIPTALLYSKDMVVAGVQKAINLTIYCYQALKDIFAGSEVEQQSIFEFESASTEVQQVTHIDRHHTVVSDINAPYQTIIAAQQMPATDSKDLELAQAGAPAPIKEYHLPDLNLFENKETKNEDKKIADELKDRAEILVNKLERFGVMGKVVAIKPGPVVTLFEYQPAPDTKISKIIALEDDLALALQALSIRIIAPIPGTSVVGFEVANPQRKSVYLSSLVQSSEYKHFSGALPLILGQDTVGSKVIVDLVRMPHLLIAGSTGSGKSVALNAMLVSLLCNKNPDELKLILIDPKRLEFASYSDIAHLIFPIVTDPRHAVQALRWVVNTMEERYEKMAQHGVRNIGDYKKAAIGQTEPMPYIVVVIDELADLMMTAGKDVEELITRLSQMARAAGIHLIVATQRPSVDVITGLIKVNFPSRISFRVTSKIDSRTILDCAGADKLLGRGDMLFLDASSSSLQRVHGAYVTDKEISALVTHIRAERPTQYLSWELEVREHEGLLTEEDDELYKNIILFLNDIDEISISLLQRRFRIGYNRSARIIDALEAQGKILPSDGGKLRKVIRS